MTQDKQRNNKGQFIKGNSGWWDGKHLSKEHKRNMSKAHVGHRIDEEIKQKISLSLMGKKNYNYGRNFSKETREKMSEARKGVHYSEATRERIGDAHRGAKSHFWQGGISFEPYGLEFNKQLKERIRKRDSYRCQECFRHQDELFKNTKAGIKPYKLHVHHIDYNKKNNDSNNLISLCMGCHLQTNYGREDWTNYFQN